MKTRMRFLLWACLSVFAWANCCVPTDAGSFLAFSLQEAESLLKKSGPAGAELTRVGGITLPLALVYDDQTRDLILVGRVEEGRPPVLLDDMAVSVRAVLKHGRPPLVSIDRLPDTTKTGRQRVRFEGGIEDTSFGQDMLLADIVLKKLGLGMLLLDVGGIEPYFELSAAVWRNAGAEDGTLCRFWFVPTEQSFTGFREGVVVVQKLTVDVKTELLWLREDASPGAASTAAPARDDAAERFAAAVAGNLNAMATAFPELRRLDPLFRLAGLAEGLSAMQRAHANVRPDLRYWLEQYPVARVDTPTRYPLLVRSEFMRKGSRATRMSMEGGISLKGLILELGDGDINAFRKLVLYARPKGRPLTWRVPLEAWPLPGAAPVDVAQAVKAAEAAWPAVADGPACSLLKRFEAAIPNDRMQTRLEVIRRSAQQTALQPHTLDIARYRAAPHLAVVAASLPLSRPAPGTTAAEASLARSPATSLADGPTRRLETTLRAMNAMDVAAAVPRLPEFSTLSRLQPTSYLSPQTPGLPQVKTPSLRSLEGLQGGLAAAARAPVGPPTLGGVGSPFKIQPPTFTPPRPTYSAHSSGGSRISPPSMPRPSYSPPSFTRPSYSPPSFSRPSMPPSIGGPF